MQGACVVHGFDRWNVRSRGTSRANCSHKLSVGRSAWIGEREHDRAAAGRDPALLEVREVAPPFDGETARRSWVAHEALAFGVEADEHGKTSAPGVYEAGEIRGPMSPTVAAEQGLAEAKAFS